MAMTHSENITSENLAFDLNSVPMDVFDLSDSGLRVESLTAGHGMVEGAASGTNCPSFCSCS